MLIQTIKSRNLWLWSESVIPSTESSEANNIKTHKQTMEKVQEDASCKLTDINEKLKSQNITASEKRKLEVEHKSQTAIAAGAESLIKKDEKNLEELSAGEANNIEYVYEYSDPFKITALQSLEFTWDNPVGESYGLSTNFLQAWHNKPVKIQFSGISYIGAFGGDTVGDLANIENKNDIFNAAGVSSLTGLASSAISTVQNALNRDKSTADAKGKYYLEADADIFKINDLLSKYGEGMYYNKSAKDSSTWIYLLVENELGQIKDGKNLSYATFIGHITNFDYKENVQNPFLYNFNCTFIGEPTLTEKVKSGDIKANQDKNSLKLSMVSSNSGFSLGYGF